MHDDPLFDEVGGGAYLGGDGKPISPRTMQRMRLEGTGPEFIRIGRLIRYRKSALNTYLNAHVQRSTSEYASAQPTVAEVSAESAPADVA